MLGYDLLRTRPAYPMSTRELDRLFEKQITFRTAVAIESVDVFEVSAVNRMSRHCPTVNLHQFAPFLADHVRKTELIGCLLSEGPPKILPVRVPIRDKQLL